MMNRSVAYAIEVVSRRIVAPAQVRKAGENFLYESIVCERSISVIKLIKM